MRLTVLLFLLKMLSQYYRRLKSKLADDIYLTGSNEVAPGENSISVSEENAGLLITQPGSIILFEQTFFH